MLKKNSDEKIGQFLSELHVYHYSIDTLLKGIVNLRIEIGHEKYARIIKLMLEQFSDAESIDKIKENDIL